MHSSEVSEADFVSSLIGQANDPEGLQIHCRVEACWFILQDS